MSQKQRRILLLFFLLLFLVISPSLILFSLGYKYNWQKNRLEKTGVFYIKSFPKNAEIYLDGEKYKKGTPTQITRLLPKNYRLEVKKEGYRTWQKNLSIYPQITTFVEDISLFKNDLKWTTLLEGSFIDFNYSPNKQFLALLEDSDKNKTVWIYNLLNGNFTKIYETDKLAEIKLESWSFSSKKLIISQNNSYLIINTEQPDYLIDIKEITQLPVSHLKWHSLNDNLLFAESQSSLYEIDIITQKTTLKVNDHVIAYEPFKNFVVYISKEKNTYFLKKIEGQTDIIFSLPYSSKYVFGKNDDFLLLADQQQDLLYLLTPDENQPIYSVIKNIKDFTFHDGNMVYWNNAELWVYYPPTKEEILLERTSKNISFGFWHPNSTYIFGIIGNRFKIFELDGRDQRNVYELFEDLGEINNFIMADKKGNFLYLVASHNNKPGFYKVEIQ